jgi:2-polyprenyl-3-methyl-5-hydroxy-6-metoxy-1,4-benzoquinol methylase
MKIDFDAEQEKAFLNSLVADYKDQSKYSQLKKDIILNLIDPYLVKASEKKGLQLGCANGYETQKLATKLNSLTVLDGSSEFIEQVKKTNAHKNIDFVFTLFEDFCFEKRQEKFDFIFCSYVLEHVFNTEVILSNLKGLLKPNGLIFVVVPNSNALSRKLALKMGLIKNLEALTENDHRHGHRRVFNQASLKKVMSDNGFTIVGIKGIIFKILADFQLNQLLDIGILNVSHINGLQKLVEDTENIEFADSFFLIASN